MSEGKARECQTLIRLFLYFVAESERPTDEEGYGRVALNEPFFQARGQLGTIVSIGVSIQSNDIFGRFDFA